MLFIKKEDQEKIIKGKLIKWYWLLKSYNAKCGIIS